MYMNQRNYGFVKYPSKTHPDATCATSGCGPVSVAIVLDNFKGFEWFTVPEICEYSISHGCRDNEGTNVEKLLKCICSNANGFSYRVTNNINDLQVHLSNGGMALLNQGDSYNVFSNAGHFVSAVGISGDVVEVYDPYMYSGKYHTKSRQSRIVSATRWGCKVKLSEIAKACSDRSPRYYLISYNKNKDQTKKLGGSNSQNNESHTNVNFKIGKTYTLKYNMNVRHSPGGSQKLRRELTSDGRKHSINQSYAVLIAGTKCTVQSVKEDGNYVWVKIPSGWIAGYNKNSNKYYIG